MSRPMDERFWTDLEGLTHRVPTHKWKLFFSKTRLHARLRAYVFRRDNFACQECGVRPDQMPSDDYDGRYGPRVNPGMCLVMDHRLSIRNGGTNHPLNLQTLCDSCNARKASLIDRKFRREESTS